MVAQPNLKDLPATREAPSVPRVPSAASTPGTRLSGDRLIHARVAWGVTAGLMIGLYVLLLPAYWTQLRTVCVGATCSVVQPSPASAQTLHQFGISVGEYATRAFASTLASTLICLVVGAVIVWRRSNDWLALITALAAVALGTLYVSYVQLPLEQSPWQVPAIVLNLTGNAAQFLFIALFPGGRFVPAWTRWLLVGWIACGVAFLGARTLPLAYLLLNLVWFGTYATLALAQIYRYQRVSTESERQQAKWVVLGWVVAVAIALGVKAPTLVFPTFGQPGTYYDLASGFGYFLAITVVCLSMGIAILRSHLFDIDVIIRQALVYGALTGALTLVYASTIVGIQAIVQTAEGRQPLPPVVIVASTLLIAALFQPLRLRIQRFIDRRFYRSKYDAAQTVAQLGRTIRSEVDLTRLTDHLLGVVGETMQPSHVSLWLVRLEYSAPQGERTPWRRTEIAVASGEERVHAASAEVLSDPVAAPDGSGAERA